MAFNIAESADFWDKKTFHIFRSSYKATSVERVRVPQISKLI